MPVEKDAVKLAVSALAKNFWLFLVIVALVIAAQWALFAHTLTGVYVNAAAFAVLVGLALWRDNIRQVCLSVAILPVAMMVSLILPQTAAFAQTVVLYSVLLILALVYRFAFTLDYPLWSTSLALRGYMFAVPWMIIIGELLGVVGYGLLRNQYPFGHTSLPLVAGACVIFAITEEMLFRGLIQQRASLVLHPGVAAAMSALLYAAYTFGHTGSWLSPLFGLIMGTVLAIIYYKKQNLILTIAVNSIAKLSYIGLMAALVFHH